MKIDKTGDHEITVRIETNDERDALIYVLDTDRNHPARGQLYDVLCEFRHHEQAREQMKWILDVIDGLSYDELLRVRDALRAIGVMK
jgi:hypothetical protein